MIQVKMRDAKLLALAEFNYSQTNQGQLATNFEQIAANFAGPDSELSGSNSFELVYHGSINGLTNAGSVILMRETQSWPTIDGQYAKGYAFADGHAEVAVEPSDNFDAFEQAHSAAPAASQ